VTGATGAYRRGMPGATLRPIVAKIRIQCSECGHEARVPETFRNKKVRCLRCHSKLRVPEDAPYAEPKKAKKRAPRRPSPPAPEEKQAKRRVGEATRGGPSSKTRRSAQRVLRELLHDYDHAIESVPRGFEIDLRGVAFGLARTLVEEMLDCRSIRDVKLAGGTGECRIIVTLEGVDFDPEDSFADDDEDTEVFQRPSGGGWAPDGLIEPAIGLDAASDDPALDLDDGDVPVESQMQSIFTAGQGRTTKRGADLDPVQLYEEARGHLDEGEPREAIKLLEKAVKADKNFARAVHALGKAYASSGDYQRSRRAFRHLTKLETDDPEAHVLYAAAAVRCDRLDEARHALKAAIKIDAEYKQAYRYAAQLYDRLGEPDKARKFRARYQALKLKG